MTYEDDQLDAVRSLHRVVRRELAEAERDEPGCVRQIELCVAAGVPVLPRPKDDEAVSR